MPGGAALTGPTSPVGRVRRSRHLAIQAASKTPRSISGRVGRVRRSRHAAIQAASKPLAAFQDE
ncbi:hypothetical protein ENTCAN_07908 [Enterobacter cancerogenus ATCC 35316]|nr:hypothetical protein ENTCAN_07908 [Enterobacter cancerogenus ATCC 35316]